MNEPYVQHIRAVCFNKTGLETGQRHLDVSAVIGMAVKIKVYQIYGMVHRFHRFGSHITRLAATVWTYYKFIHNFLLRDKAITCHGFAS